MQLRGRIDRVDAANVNGNMFVRIVDYKSSKKGIDLNEVYHGLSLQMLTYLDVAIENAEVWLHEDADLLEFYMCICIILLSNRKRNWKKTS